MLKLGTDRARPVYDLTTFSSDHPGGIEALENCAGTDGTDSYDYAGHSDSNMEKMQQYRVGTLAGSLEQPSPISQNIIPVESKRIKSAISYLEHLEFPGWTKLAVTICAASLVVALSYHQRNGLVDYISFTTKMPRLQFGITSEQNIGQAFWVGMAVALSCCCVGFGYLYRLFLSTLDYQNDVFSFPATIPRKTKR